MYHSFLIHSFTDGHLGFFQHLAIVNCVAMNIEVHKIFWNDVSGFLGCNLSSGIARSKGSSTFSFLRKSHTVLHSGSPVYIPTKRVLGFPFLHKLTNTYLLICLCWPFWLVWSGISLWFYFASPWWLVMLSIFSYISGPSVCPPWRSVFSGPLPIFQLDCLTSWSWAIWVIYIFWILNLYPMYHWQICSPTEWVPFSFCWWFL